MADVNHPPLSVPWLLFDRACAASQLRPIDYLRGGYVVEGLSYRDLAARIREDFGISVSHEWVRQQVERLGIERAA
jgi:hypothetical protein